MRYEIEQIYRGAIGMLTLFKYTFHGQDKRIVAFHKDAFVKMERALPS
jgi:hypothetical protein